MYINQQTESAQVRYVKRRYKNSFRKKAKEIKAYIKHIRRLENSEDEADNMVDSYEPSGDPVTILYQEIYEYFHKLAGSSGMYGFYDISKKCRKIMFFIDVNEYNKTEKKLIEVRKLLRFYAKK